MEAKILEKDEFSLRFVLSGASAAFANALRRVMISEVPTMAIDDVMILENNSYMYDEIIAHRLGLIPLKTDLDSYVLPEECDCKSELGCNRCRCGLTLEVEASEEVVTVYSDQLKPETDIVPVSPKVPIVKLGPFQKLRLEAYARLGRGAEHAKWQPVAVCVYKYLPHVKLTEKGEQCKELVEICPRHVFGVNNLGKVYVKNESDCTLCMDCIERSPIKPPPVKVEWEDDTFIFTVESTGALPAVTILREAIRLLGRKASSFSSQLKEVAS